MSCDIRAMWELVGGKAPAHWDFITLEKLLETPKSVSVGVMYPGADTEGGVPLIKVSDVKNGALVGKPDFCISTEVDEEYKRTRLNGSELLITLVGNPGDCVLVTEEMKGWNAARALAVVRLKNLDLREWLRYVLLSRPAKHIIDARLNTTVQKTLNLKDVKELPIPLPPANERDLITKNIRDIEKKLVLNTLVNQTLQQMSQAIFKSWFVDFDPVKAKMNGEQPEGMDAATASLFPEKLVESELGLIPEGWEVNQLSDICKNHSQSYDLKSVDEVIFVNTGDVLEGDFLHKDYSPVAGLPGQAKKAIKEDDILYSEIRPKNKRFAYVDFDVSDYVVSTKFMVIQANEKMHPRLLYMILTRQNTIDEFNVIADSRSGTFPQITFKAISNLNFCIAPREVQDAFVTQVMPMIKLQRSLKTENKQLAELRDTLLPKLLSGEIELGQTQELIEVE